MDMTVLISAPSDQEEAVNVVVQAISQLDEVLRPHGHSLRCQHWKLNLSTGRGPRGQEVVNEQIGNCDAIVAIFGTRLGTDTGKYPSGTVEELFEFIERKKSDVVEFDVHVFFNADPAKSPFDIVPDELRAVQAFRATLAEMGIYYSQFTSREALARQVSIGLSSLIGRQKSQLVSPKGLEQFDEIGFSEAMQAYNQELDEARIAIIAIGDSMAGTNSSLEELNSRDGFDTTSLERASDIIDSSKEELAPLAQALETHLELSIANLNLALSIAVEDLNFTSNSDEASELSEAIEQAAMQMDEFVASLNNAYGSLSRIPRLTSKLNKAKRGLMSIYQLIIDSVGRSANEFRTIRAQWLD